jgi:twinkle protein
MDQSSRWVKTHHECDKCGSSDAASTNSDGWSTCFSCDSRWKNDGVEYVKKEDEGVITMTISQSPYRMIRSIESRTCERYGIKQEGNRTIFEYKDEYGMVCAQKIRAGSKENQFTEGMWSDGVLFGQNLFNGGGRYVTITEGEFDAASAYQMMGSKYPVVSIRNGAKSALRDCKKHFKWLDSFENIVICFDGDEVGQDAAREVAALFAGKSKVFKHLPDYKDANEYLEHGKAQAFTAAWWAAETYTPEGIVAGSTLWDLVNRPSEKPAAKYRWDGLNAITHGIRTKELVTLAAGSGVGKSQIMREILYHVLKTTDDNIGAIFLEEGLDKTAQSIMSIEANKRLHIPEVVSTEEERRKAFDATLGTDRIFFYDLFGSTTVENIMSQVRYLAKAHDCKYIFLDHLSIIVSSQENGDERKAIDQVMTLLRTLTQETGICLFLISHLKRPVGKGHEEGATISLADMRGSASIAQLSDIVLGFERNGQHEDTAMRNTTNIRVLKNRFSGETGLAASVLYDTDTGRINEVDKLELEDIL